MDTEIEIVTISTMVVATIVFIGVKHHVVLHVHLIGNSVSMGCQIKPTAKMRVELFEPNYGDQLIDDDNSYGH